MAPFLGRNEVFMTKAGKQSDQTYKVFVSSIFLDNREPRMVVENAILETG